MYSYIFSDIIVVLELIALTICGYYIFSLFRALELEEESVSRLENKKSGNIKVSKAKVCQITACKGAEFKTEALGISGI